MENKLYIKVKCSICRGLKPFSCYYCDARGESFIEASYTTIVRIALAILPDDVLDGFLTEKDDEDEV